MPYSNIGEIPKGLKTAGLTLAQANDWARYFDDAKNQKGITSPAAIAWKIFKQKYYQSGNTWIRKKAPIKAEIKKDIKKINTNIAKEKVLFNPVIDLSIKNKIKTKEEDSMKKTDIKGYELVYRSNVLPISLEEVDGEGRLYEKELIREGEWAHPQNSSLKLKITLDRMKKWIENFDKGLFKVPVPKRHSLDPEDNRGWVKGLSLRKDDNGKYILFGKLDITNDVMQNAINNGDIQDVSVSIGNYTDNKGSKHGEVLQHVALTVIPHIDNQAGFTPISAEGYVCLEEVRETKVIEEEDEKNVLEKEKTEKEVKEMAELEEMQGKYDELEITKVGLEAKIAELEPKIVELEKSNKEMKDVLDKIELEKKAKFEAEVDSKVDKYIEEGHIFPAEKDDVKVVLLAGGKASEMLEKTLADRKAVDLSTKSKSDSTKPNEGDEMTDEKAQAEAERIDKESK